jgi:hypothetical protein
MPMNVLTILERNIYKAYRKQGAHVSVEIFKYSSFQNYSALFLKQSKNYFLKIDAFSS